MSRTEAIRQQLDIRRARIPDGEIRADLRDLAAVGLASTTPGITKADMRELVKDALANGRSWDEIGQRLGMTARHARRVYGAHVARPPDHGAMREMLADVLRWWLSVAEGRARDHSGH